MVTYLSDWSCKIVVGGGSYRGQERGCLGGGVTVTDCGAHVCPHQVLKGNVLYVYCRNIEVMKQRLKDLWKEGAHICLVPGSTGELAKVRGRPLKICQDWGSYRKWF